MNSTELTVTLPEELIERANAEGVPINDASIAMMIETELVRAQSVRMLREAMKNLEGSLTPEEIEAELLRAKADRLAQRESKPKA